MLTRGLSRAMLAIAAVAGAFLALWPTTLSLAERWADTVTRAYTHGSLVPLIVAFLIWRRKDLLEKVTVAPSWPAFVAGIGAGIVWLICLRGGIQIAHQVLLPVIAALAVGAALGTAALRVLALPLAYLYFTVPVWDAINPALQWASAYAVRGLVSLLGIPVYFDGLNFQIPAGVFHVAGGCSGLHFFIVAAAVAVFYGELHRDKFATRLKLVMLALGFALITNWLRIAIIIYFGHKTDMQHHLVSDEHYSFGWGMFAVAMVCYFLIVRRWQAPADAPQTAANLSTAGIPGVGVLLGLAVLLVPGGWYGLDDNLAGSEPRGEGISQWRERGEDYDKLPRPRSPLFVGADGYWVLSAGGDPRVDSLVIGYREQAQGRELAGYANRPEGPDLERLSQTVGADPDHLEIKARDAAGADWLVWVEYAIDGRPFINTLSASVYYGALSLWSDPYSAAWVRRTPCVPDCPAARERLLRAPSPPRGF
jgi:exosortase A